VADTILNIAELSRASDDVRVETIHRIVVSESATASDVSRAVLTHTVVAVDGARASDGSTYWLEIGTRPRPTSVKTPRAALTTMGRDLVRGAQQGRPLLLTRALVGTSWEQPRWGRIPNSSEDTTELIAPFAWGTVEIEGHSSRALACRCRFQQAVLGAQELVLYARTIDLTEVPFAVALFPTWFLATAEAHVARIIIPL